MKRKILKLDRVSVTFTHLKDGRGKVEVKQGFFNENVEWTFWLPDHRVGQKVGCIDLIKERMLRDFAVDVGHVSTTYKNEV